MSSVPHLFVLVDATNDIGLLPALAEAGVDGFQVRAKSLNDVQLIEFTRRVMRQAPDVPVIVNDRVDIALAAGADGVHLGANDLPIDVAREIAPDLIIGGTCRNRAGVVAAREAGADYVGFGPIFATSSKPDLPDSLGLAAIADARGELPLIAIGGFTATRARQARALGAHGVAVIGAIWSAADPVAAAKEFVS